jgi:hypothetical protein
VDHFVKGALEAARAWWIDRDGDQSGANAAKKGADHLEARRVSEEKAVLRLETTILPQVTGYRLCAFDKRSIGVAFDLIAVQVKVRIKKLVWVLVTQPVQLL